MNAIPHYPIEALSKRELEVLSELAKGKSRSEVSTQMGISLATYDGYRKSIRQKLRIKTQVEWGRVFMKIEELNKKKTK
ncbi:response regulator transcription factor [Ekhidna sp.]|uniref:response regulator transcription factor n=1 Tax=Ekhidna sp. TaxID=2608089 RepID=UPI003B508FFE